MTRKHLVLLMFLASTALFIGTTTTAFANGVAWQPLSFDNALAKAKTQQSLVVIDFFADWCGPCHKYDREVFNRDDTANAFGQSVVIRINAEKGEGPKLVKRYHVVGYPTILFLKPDGTEVDRIFGFMPAKDFNPVAKGFVTGRETLATMRSTLAKNPTDHELRFKTGERLAIRGELEASLKTFAPIFDQDASNAHGYVPRIHLVLGKYAYLRGRKDYPGAIRHLKSIVEKFPKSKEVDPATFALARAWFKSGKPNETLTLFDAWIATKPKEVSRYNSVAWFCFQQKFERKKGIAYALKGLKIDPKASYLWDTLAELYFVEGRQSEAVSAIDKAIAAKPDDTYYSKQRKKFAKGLK